MSEAAVLACQYASRPSISANNASYQSNVDTFIAQAFNAQNFAWTQSTAQPFTYVQGGAANVSLSAQVPTAFLNVLHVSQIGISATSHCYDTPPTQAAANSPA